LKGGFIVIHKPFVLSTKALVADGAGRYLVLRRSGASKNNAGLWDLPGGKTDPGETFDTALIREIKEETGLAVTLIRVLGADQSDIADRTVVYLFMEVRAESTEVRISDEHDEFAWLTPTKLAEAQLCPQFRGIARNVSAGSLKST
jgi:8-oxo-dGTP diphosphatase